MSHWEIFIKFHCTSSQHVLMHMEYVSNCFQSCFQTISLKIQDETLQKVNHSKNWYSIKTNVPINISQLLFISISVAEKGISMIFRILNTTQCWYRKRKILHVNLMMIAQKPSLGYGKHFILCFSISTADAASLLFNTNLSSSQVSVTVS